MSAPKSNIDQNLIYKYLSGQADELEIAQLEQWVQADSANRDYFMTVKKVWMLSGVTEKTADIDIEQAWRRVERATTKKFFIGRKPFLRVAAAILFLMLATFVLYQSTSSKLQRFAANDRIHDVVLDDGSQITLNRDAEITYDPSDENLRKVALEGGAFFDVARDEAKPFIISAAELEIEVLGTSFYIDARKDARFLEVIVESGRVAVRYSGEELIISKDEKIILDKVDKNFIRKKNEDANFKSIVTGQLVFDDTPLSQVTAALNRHYGSNVLVTNNAAHSCRLTATYENKSLESVLNIIESSLGIRIIRQKKAVLFEGSCTLD